MVTGTEVIGQIRETIGRGVISTESPREKRVYVGVEPAVLRKTIEMVSKKYQARFMSLSAVDAGLDIELLYHFSLGGIVLTIQAEVPKEMNEIDTIADFMPATRWAEREVTELFDVKFREHPKLERVLLPEEARVEAPPLRKPFESKLPDYTRTVAGSLISTGCTTPVSSVARRKRETAGLPPSPPATCASEEMLGELQELMRRVHFDKKAGYDWKKKKLRGKRGG